jgi:hypothetical protein
MRQSPTAETVISVSQDLFSEVCRIQKQTNISSKITALKYFCFILRHTSFLKEYSIEILRFLRK